MARRALHRKHLFSPDNSHLHHRLLALDFSHGMVVAILYFFSYLLALVAIIGRKAPDYLQFYGLLAFVAAFYGNLRLMERAHVIKGSLWIFSIQLPFFKLQHNPRLHRLYISLLRTAKYLLVSIFVLTMFIPPVLKGDIGIIAGFLLALFLMLLLIPQDKGNRFILFVIYFIGAFMVFLMHNYAGSVQLFGIPLLAVSDVVFCILLLVAISLAAIRANPVAVLSTPLEYLILFLVISVPLLPEPFRSQFHLLVVAGKSVIMFVALKLVLKLRAQRNRKIILAALVTLLVVALRNILAF
jgi:UDP-GlcNAc:undecaprenyl-phosphate GlcNAc-1-phosphate transferase